MEYKIETNSMPFRILTFTLIEGVAKLTIADRENIHGYSAETVITSDKTVSSVQGVDMVRELLKNAKSYHVNDMDDFTMFLEFEQWLDKLVELCTKFGVSMNKPFWEWTLPHRDYGVPAFGYLSNQGEIGCAKCATEIMLDPFELEGFGVETQMVLYEGCYQCEGCNEIILEGEED